MIEFPEHLCFINGVLLYAIFLDGFVVNCLQGKEHFLRLFFIKDQIDHTKLPLTKCLDNI